MWRVALLAALALGCRPAPRMTVPAAHGAAIGTITLPWSQAHVVFGARPLLVDTGAAGQLHELVGGLRRLGVNLADVKCAVVTHAHADHAGTARALQVKGVTIIAGAADVERTRRGVHGPHHPTSTFARVLAWFLPETYKPFVADVLVHDRYDLAPCGVDGEVIAVGGHTPGSVVVVVGGGRIALVGDLFRGGLVRGGAPAVHFYQDDRALAHRRIRELLARGVAWFVLGHAGPIPRAAVAAEADFR